jgi:hypothetical protein
MEAPISPVESKLEEVRYFFFLAKNTLAPHILCQNGRPNEKEKKIKIRGASGKKMVSKVIY